MQHAESCSCSLDHRYTRLAEVREKAHCSVTSLNQRLDERRCKEMTTRRWRQRSDQPATEHDRVKAARLIITGALWRVRERCIRDDTASRRLEAARWDHLPRRPRPWSRRGRHNTGGVSAHAADAAGVQSEAYMAAPQPTRGKRHGGGATTVHRSEPTALVSPPTRSPTKKTPNCKRIAPWGASGGSWQWGEVVKPRMSPRTTTGCRRDPHRDPRTLVLVNGLVPMRV